jgi:hypothetical protein
MTMASLAAVLVLGIATLGTGQRSLVASAQERTATTDVKIDNFSFGPAALTHHSDVDESR